MTWKAEKSGRGIKIHNALLPHYVHSWNIRYFNEINDIIMHSYEVAVQDV